LLNAPSSLRLSIVDCIASSDLETVQLPLKFFASFSRDIPLDENNKYVSNALLNQAKIVWDKVLSKEVMHMGIFAYFSLATLLFRMGLFLSLDQQTKCQLMSDWL
jgi:hypothetical protein